MFKGDGEASTLVCTPTLELGVDIGGLDAVLMRNVPLPAGTIGNVRDVPDVATAWMDITYARPPAITSSKLEDPLLALAAMSDHLLPTGPMTSWSRKHVHATVLTTMNRLSAGRKAVCRTQAKESAELFAPCSRR